METLSHQGTAPGTGRHLCPAIFLDRDGTIIEDRGNLWSPSQAVFFDDTIPALQRLQKHYLLFIVTNQPGVAKGELTAQEVNRVNESILSLLACANIQIVATFICPHEQADGCLCRKPNPYFLLKAASEHGVDLEHSFVIGDHPSDMQCAWNAGAKGIYVLTGHGGKHFNELRHGDRIVSGILEATDWILAQPDDRMDSQKTIDTKE